MSAIIEQALRTALQPVMGILTDPKTEDFAVQEPGVGWWYRGGMWHRVDAPEMNFERLRGISKLAGSQTGQEISSRSPILSADLLGDLRLHSVMPPAVAPGTVALTLRRGDKRVDDVSDVPTLFDTSRWNQWSNRGERRRQQDGALLERYDAGDIVGFLTGLAVTRQTGFFGGPTGAGKTRLSKMLGGLIPLHERIITIENARELIVPQPNNVRHFYAGSGAGVSSAELMKATLRERPDRVILAEMRDPEEAAVFLAEVMAGHPGSMSTLHGRSAPESARRLFNLIKGSDAGRSTDVETIVAQLAASIDFIVPVENDMGQRSIGEVWFRADAERRGETFADLLKAI